MKKMKRNADLAKVNPAAAIASGMIVLLLLGLSALAHGGVRMQPAAAGGEDKQVVVKIDNFSFSPSTLTVSPGTKVTWVNRDDIPHTVVSPEKKFKSDVLDTDQQFSFTFTATGTYDYFCSLHPKMTGKVVVQ
jgi:amicyanin